MNAATISVRLARPGELPPGVLGLTRRDTLEVIVSSEAPAFVLLHELLHAGTALLGFTHEPHGEEALVRAAHPHLERITDNANGRGHST